MSLLKVNEIQVFNGTTVTITAITAETSADLNVGADLDVTGALTLGTALAIAEGGTGATDAATARTNLDVDQAGTDNSTDVTLVTTSHDYLSITGQAITLGPIDLTADVTGTLPVGNGGTGVTSLGSLNAADLGSGAAADGYVLTADGAGGAVWEAVSGGTDVTLAGSLDYLTLSGQEITQNAIDLTTDVTGTLPVGNGGTGVTSLGSLNAADLGSSTATDGYVLTADGSGGAAWEAVTPNLEGGVVINESGADVDFRVESDTVDHALFVDGATGYVGIGVASPSDKLHVDGNIRLTAGGGINFSAYATSGNPSSNLLDDYEEGTFDVGITFGGASVGMTFNARTFNYTKIGNVVYIKGYVNLGNKGSSSGTALITGLPFTSSPSGAGYSAFSFHINGMTFSGYPNGFIAGGQTSINLYECTDAGSASDIRDTDFTNTTGLIISGFYTTAS